MNAEMVLFWVFAAGTVGSALVVILARSPISSAMSLVSTFFFLAGLYVLLWAPTLAVLQVLVYAGAIMVLFLFVIMLLSLAEAGPRAPLTVGRIFGGAAALGLLVALWSVLARLPPSTPRMGPGAQTFGSLATLGHLLYTGYLFPFEAISLLLLVAIVGAVVVAKSRI